MSEIKDKIVEFENWCKLCKHYTKSGNDEPCETCLTNPVNENSHKPTEWEQCDGIC